MSVYVNWYDADNHIILYTFEGAWTWDEFHLAVDASHELPGERDTPVVYVIADFTDTKNVPNGAITHIRSRVAKKIDHVGIVVIVAESKLIETLLNAATSMMQELQNVFYMVNTPDEALSLVHERRMGLG